MRARFFLSSILIRVIKPGLLRLLSSFLRLLVEHKKEGLRPERLKRIHQSESLATCLISSKAIGRFGSREASTAKWRPHEQIWTEEN